MKVLLWLLPYLNVYLFKTQLYYLISTTQQYHLSVSYKWTHATKWEGNEIGLRLCNYKYSCYHLGRQVVNKTPVTNQKNGLTRRKKWNLTKWLYTVIYYLLATFPMPGTILGIGSINCDIQVNDTIQTGMYQRSQVPEGQ